MNKKGAFNLATKTIYWMIAAFVISMLIVAFVLLVTGYLGKLTYVSPILKGGLISLKFVNNADCFAYQDPVSERVFPGTIDLTKFTSERMDECYRTGKDKDSPDYKPSEDFGYRDFNFQLQLLNTNRNVETNNFFTAGQVFYDQEVLVKDGDTIIKDTLRVIVQETIPKIPKEGIKAKLKRLEEEKKKIFYPLAHPDQGYTAADVTRGK